MYKVCKAGISRCIRYLAFTNELVEDFDLNTTVREFVVPKLTDPDLFGSFFLLLTNNAPSNA